MAVTQSPAMRRMIAARGALVLDRTFWGALALKLRLAEDPSCKSAWVDGRTLGFNPEYVMSLPTAGKVKALWGHEVGHCAYEHPWRRTGRDEDEWNVACDMALNPMLRKEGFDLPDDVLYPDDPSWDGKSAEWIYNRRQQQSGGEDKGERGDTGDQQQQSDTKQPQQPQQDNSSADGDAQQDDQGEPDRPSAGEGKPQPFGGEVRDAPTNPDEEGETPSGEDWKQAVEQAAHIAKGQGSLSAGAERLFEYASQPDIDWRSVTLRFAQEVTAGDYTWAVPNRRYLPMGFYLPSMQEPSVGAMVVALDTSGSIDAVMVGLFEACLQGVVNEVRPRCIYVMYCDAELQRVDRFDRDEPVEIHPTGGGGTSFIPVFNELGELDEEPVCMFYLTDLRGTFPTDDCGVPTLWVTPNRHAQTDVPFGEIVAIEE